MNLLAEINRGAPPTGLGIFLRADYRGSTTTEEPWSFVVVNAGRADYAHEAGLAKADGKEVWLYSMPGSFTPASWRDGLALLLTRAEEVGAAGIMVDPETSWAGVNNEIVHSFGMALRDAATVTRVGITSYPSWGPMAALAAAAGDACFGVPQLYGQHGAFTQTEIDAQWSHWRQSFGTRLIPGFALWVPGDHPEMNDPAVYSAYLDRLPRAGGAIGWTTNGPIPVHMMRAVEAWNPRLSMFALGALAWVGRPAGAITLGIGIALLVMLLLFAREVRHA